MQNNDILECYARTGSPVLVDKQNVLECQNCQQHMVSWCIFASVML